jgi:hypothetical protein
MFLSNSNYLDVLYLPPRFKKKNHNKLTPQLLKFPDGVTNHFASYKTRRIIILISHLQSKYLPKHQGDKFTQLTPFRTFPFLI